MKYYKKIVGEKVYLSPMSVDDCETYVEWINDDDVSINLMFLPHIYSVPMEREALEGLTKSDNNFAIVDKETDKLIGSCGFMKEDKKNRITEVGIFIGDKNYWSKGYGSDALRCLLNFGFKVRNYNNICLHVLEFNKRAIACYEKVGFKRQGVMREAVIFGDKKFDKIYMDILASEYKTDYLEKYWR